MKTSRSRRASVVTVLAASALTVLVGVCVVAGVWFITSQLTSTVAEGDTDVTLTAPSATARVTLPDGWSWRPRWADPAGGAVTSPDRQLSVSVRLLVSSDPKLAIEQATGAVLGPFSEEPLAGEATAAKQAPRLLYARDVDGNGVSGAIVSGTDVLTFTTSSPSTYDLELAKLLSLVVFGSAEATQ